MDGAAFAKIREERLHVAVSRTATGGLLQSLLQLARVARVQCHTRDSFVEIGPGMEIEIRTEIEAEIEIVYYRYGGPLDKSCAVWQLGRSLPINVPFSQARPGTLRLAHRLRWPSSSFAPPKYSKPR